jgi:predicted RNA-binding protein with RPS1 domain
MSVGDKVTGVVIARAHFGAWIDLDVGFPALLQIIEILELMMPGAYRAGDWCPVGSVVSASVTGFLESPREIYLSQRRVPSP